MLDFVPGLEGQVVVLDFVVHVVLQLALVALEGAGGGGGAGGVAYTGGLHAIVGFSAGGPLSAIVAYVQISVTDILKKDSFSSLVNLSS